MPEDHFGERIAERYDESSADMFEPEVVDPVIDFLAGLAGDGAALELGIGTGRIALPLARRGVRVRGIDLSEAMVARLRGKPGAEDIDVTIGDFATTRVEGTFSVAYLVFNTINNLTTQDAQVACFRNVAAHLEPGGCFVIEVAVPALQRLPPGETVRPFHVSATRLGFDEYDVASQGLISHHYSLVGGELEVLSIPFRYVWPSELDLMARLAGMTLRERWSGWKREPFTSESTQHVSVWQKTCAGDEADEISGDRPVRLQGERVVLRPLGIEDIQPVAEIQAEAGVARWWGHPDYEDLGRKAAGSSEEKAFAIETDGELVGLIEFSEENEPGYRHAGIDLFLAERAQGRGLGSDAVRTLARYLTEERGHHRLTIDPAAENVAAIRAYEKVGFRRIGVMREYERSPDGTWHDSVLLDVLAHELDPD